MTGYIVDSSSLIRLNRQNPKARYPDLWAKLEQLAADGKLVAPREVKREIEHSDDALAEWARDNASMFVDPDDAQIESLKKIEAKFPAISKSLILATGPYADPWILALALSRAIEDWVIVTDELPKGTGSERFQISPMHSA